MLIEHSPAAQSSTVIDAEDLRMALRDFGREIHTFTHALACLISGDALYRMPWNGGEPIQVHSVNELARHPQDRVLALEADKLPGTPECAAREQGLIAAKEERKAISLPAL